MRSNLPVTDKEVILAPDTLIVSKTDLKGRITFINRDFIEISGFVESELIGEPHNIVRHPDMPRGVFKFLWDTLEQKRECFAYVKNMSKSGAFYWVFANVTPSYDAHGNVEGYFSVRRKPRREAVALLTGVYQQMLEVEQRVGPKDACAASLALLNGILASKGVDYESFILSI